MDATVFSDKPVIKFMPPSLQVGGGLKVSAMALCQTLKEAVQRKNEPIEFQTMTDKSSQWHYSIFGRPLSAKGLFHHARME